MSVPTYGSLQNKSNGEFRCNHATKLKSSYSSPDCLMNYQLQPNGTYGIKNVKNDEYFDCSITSMNGSIDGDCQLWRLLPIGDIANGYYVQNVKNGEFMTKHASQLSGSAGKDEVWIIVERDS